ncbi:MAG: DUF547 domain-containing protein [Gammaproteobacteria bacterium]|nr:DUF547 domain-containing protein [Gammaproteobacteria bacterium]
MSLYAYENDVIRKLGEPRVHFALNCVALGCPILPKKPFTGKWLDAELERETLMHPLIFSYAFFLDCSPLLSTPSPWKGEGWDGV